MRYIFSFFLSPFGIETINPFKHSRSSLKNPTRFQTKMGKECTRFQTKRHKNPTRWGGSYVYSLYRGVPSPPPPLPGVKRAIRPSRAKFLYWYICIIIKHARMLSNLSKPPEGVRIEGVSVLSGLNLEKV